MSELIECDGCGRSFAAENPADMLAAIKGSCPSCGGAFRLAEPPPPAAPASPRPAAPGTSLTRAAVP